MKGLNVKKIAAFAGALVLFGASVAVADVVYGNTQLVDQNGQPTVKVVVGSKAAISDGVAAANIAAKIANEAYKSSTLTAGVTGTPTCTVGTGTTGAGTCSIVESSKKVTLEVTLPGTIAGTHTFKTLIYDTIDRTLANRNSTLSEDVYPATLSSADTSGTVTSPLRAVETGTLKGTTLYRIGSDKFTGFADYAVVDDQGASSSYTEEQSFWIGSSAGAVAYDSSSSIKDIAVNKYSAMAYSVKFTGNDYGVPVCTGDLASNDTTNWNSCGTDSNSMTEKHRVKIKFMGGDWIISEMRDPSLTSASATNVIAGGQVKLAKEAKYGIINVGGVLDAGTFKIRLSDISVAVGSGNEHPAIIDVLDAATEQVIGQIQVTPGTTYTYTQSGTGNSVKIHVYKTAPGFTLNAKWAEMAVYTDEVTLKNGQRYNLVSSTDTDKNFKVSLLWKNRDWASGSDSSAADSLREIVVYNIDGFDSKTVAGDVVNFLKSSPTFKLTYQGVDLTADDYETLTYSAMSSDSIRVATSAGDIACNASSSGDLSYTAKLIEIKIPDQLLGGTGDVLSGDYLFDKVRFDPIGRIGANATLPNGTQNQSAVVADYNPMVFWKVSGRDCWNWNTLTYQTNNAPSATTAGIKFDTAGDNSAAQGLIYFSASGFGTFGNVSIMLQEDAGKYGTSSNSKVYTGVPVLSTDTSVNTFRFRASDSSTQNVYYDGLAGTTFTSYEPTFVSERGSKTTSVGTTDATIGVAKKIGMPTFQFAYSDTTTASSADTYTLGVGDSKVFGGVTVKVSSIDATTGSCSVLGPGGAPACTVDSTGVGAVIKPDNVASVQVTQPVALSSNLVMTDAAASGVGPVITVGGPDVNTVTADALKDAAVDFNTQPVVVKEIGNKIVVAGKSADDTLAAAAQFIQAVKRQ